MSAFEFLDQLAKIDVMIKNKEVEIEQLKSVAMKTTSCSEGERVQSSGDKQKMETAITKYIDIEIEYISGLLEARKDIISVIQKLPAAQYDVLHKIYVQHFTLPEAADILGKSYSWAKVKHRKGLANVQRILDERKENEC